MTEQPGIDSVEVGDALPPLTFGPITRHTLALYLAGSGDHNPIHVDSDFAKSAGNEDVFAHGMLSMAILGRMLTAWVDQSQIREFGVRFTAITPVHATVTAQGKIAEKFEADGEDRVRLELSTHLEDGTRTLSGTAVVALPTG